MRANSQQCRHFLHRQEYHERGLLVREYLDANIQRYLEPHEQESPLFFWIYGGRFAGGSGDVITYDGTGLASKEIIVVTINYRLGPFGLLAHPEISAESRRNSSGNYVSWTNKRHFNESTRISGASVGTPTRLLLVVS